MMPPPTSHNAWLTHGPVFTSAEIHIVIYNHGPRTLQDLEVFLASIIAHPRNLASHPVGGAVLLEVSSHAQSRNRLHISLHARDGLANDELPIPVNLRPEFQYRNVNDYHSQDHHTTPSDNVDVQVPVTLYMFRLEVRRLQSLTHVLKSLDTDPVNAVIPATSDETT